MKSRDVVGKRIVAISQTRVWNEAIGGRWFLNLDSLRLDDGSCIAIVGAPLNYDYGAEGIYVPKERK